MSWAAHTEERAENAVTEEWESTRSLRKSLPVCVKVDFKSYWSVWCLYTLFHSCCFTDEHFAVYCGEQTRGEHLHVNFNWGSARRCVFGLLWWVQAPEYFSIKIICLSLLLIFSICLLLRKNKAKREIWVRKDLFPDSFFLLKDESLHTLLQLYYCLC